ncbi:MAG TPA: valine--tRNA ligase [Mycobacteriales bacterium]|jgi:valyl-tRNA synthetase|nr:valine--tRNA ligase [Mycobacteriales bacterium]
MPNADLPKEYLPHDVEGRLYESWVARGYFGADAASEKTPYVIVIPPPNVTGSLHMGHALQHTMMDALTRRRRMQGYEALWLPGMDHAGIATQNAVERNLGEEGQTRHTLGREAFVERVWRWKEEYGGKILGQMRRLGTGVDWSRERFTMDEGLSRAVRTIFARLYEDGLIYRAERIINWCPRCMTALSDIEVEHKDVDGELVSIAYGPLTVATTRVETMLGDTAVAVHPDDERYRHLVGTTVTLPLVGREIRVVADEHVDPEFGTGAVKVTPAHDPNDFAIAQRHGLPAVDILNPDATLNDAVPEQFRGLDRFAARRAVREALAEQGLVVAEKRPYVHAVGHCQRCHTVVEPRLSLQWFVKVEPLAKAAGDAVRAGRTEFVPRTWEKTYFDWVDHMHDWCISRQLWWGHRIPVWYCANGHQVCAVDDPSACPDCGDTALRQDEDVLDTWFSSALWPFSTLGWPDDTPELRRFYPTDVLVTGYDIIFFWVARMMMFGLYAMPDVPFRTVSITGLVRDSKGQKMSKSKGNVIDPLEFMDRYGADALRFALARGANPGSDAAIADEWVEGARNFCNKLWNATRFALLSGADAAAPLPPAEELTGPDRWILSRLQRVVAAVDASYEAYEWGALSQTLYHFAWDELCDWYLELAKIPLASGDEAAVARTRAVLGHVFDTLLRLLHPVVPYVTDALWPSLTGGDSVVVAEWPAADPARHDDAAEAEVERLQAVVTEVRRFRAEQQVKPSAKLPAVVRADEAFAATYGPALASLARLDLAGEAGDGWSTVTAAGVEVSFDLSGAVDVAAERARLTKAIAGHEAEAKKLSGKLGNAAFAEKAPPAVVAETRQRLADAEGEADRLRALLAALPAQ